MENLLEIQQQTINIVKEVGQFILTEIGKIQDQNIETKSLNSLVTYVDKTSEKLIVSRLQSILPEATFLTEENTILTEESNLQWIIDPLDGTTNFIHQIPVFSISVALKQADEIILGVVYEINRDECFYASKNNGSFLNNKKIAVSQTLSLQDSLIATGFPYYDFERMENYVGILKYLMQNTRGIRRLGSAATDLCYVACGRFDAFFEYSLAAWDVAAGAFIVQEAGGLISDFSGSKNWLFGKEIIATNSNLQNVFQKIISNSFI